MAEGKVRKVESVVEKNKEEDKNIEVQEAYTSGEERYKIEVSMGITVNLGNYEFMRMDVKTEDYLPDTSDSTKKDYVKKEADFIVGMLKEISLGLVEKYYKNTE